MMSELLESHSAHLASESLTNSTKRANSRRRFLVAATTVVGVAGATVASWPFLASWKPSARARALGAPVRLDVGNIDPGAIVTVSWQGKPVWVLHRTGTMLGHLRHNDLLERLRDPMSDTETQQPAYARNELRSIRPEFLVVIAICTHLGCVPTFRPDSPARDVGEDWMGGFYCPCHGSKFDLAGRVFKNVPAPTNLIVPPHRYVDSDVLEIGIENKRRGAA